ncbi:MAG: hypothetical protein AAFW75_10140, partial [Cyanobacteria bacterium J06636_16]
SLQVNCLTLGGFIGSGNFLFKSSANKHKSVRRSTELETGNVIDLRVSVEGKSTKNQEDSVDSGERKQGLLSCSWGQIGIVQQSANSVLTGKLPDPLGAL